MKPIKKSSKSKVSFSKSIKIFHSKKSKTPLKVFKFTKKKLLLGAKTRKNKFISMKPENRALSFLKHAISRIKKFKVLKKAWMTKWNLKKRQNHLKLRN